MLVNTPWRNEGKERLSLLVRGRGGEEGKRICKSLDGFNYSWQWHGLGWGMGVDGRLDSISIPPAKESETLEHLTTTVLQYRPPSSTRYSTAP